MFTSDAEEKNFREYEEIAAEEARQSKEYRDRPLKNTWLPELLTFLEIEALDTIKEANFEIGVFLRCKDTFQTQQTNDTSNFFITLAKYKIEENFNDITRWRSYKREYC